MTQNLVFPVILKVLAFILFSDLIYHIYSRISIPRIEPNQNFKIPSPIFYNFKLLFQGGKKSDKFTRSFAYLIPVLTFIAHIFALIMLPISIREFSYTNQFSFFIFWLIMGTSPLLKILLAITSEHPAKIQTSKEIASKIVHYYLAFLISFISILMIVLYSSYNSRILNLESLIDFQTENQIMFFGLPIQFQALFILLNPFSFIAYISSILGLFRQTNLDALPNEALRIWDPQDEFSGRQLSFYKLANSMHMFLLIIQMVYIFFGVLISDSWISNILILLSLSFLVAALLAIFSRGKARIFLDRRIKSFLRIPLFFSFLSIVWSILLIYNILPIYII